MIVTKHCQRHCREAIKNPPESELDWADSGEGVVSPGTWSWSWQPMARTKESDEVSGISEVVTTTVGSGGTINAGLGCECLALKMSCREKNDKKHQGSRWVELVEYLWRWLHG